MRKKGGGKGAWTFGVEKKKKLFPREEGGWWQVCPPKKSGPEAFFGGAWPGKKGTAVFSTREAKNGRVDAAKNGQVYDHKKGVSVERVPFLGKVKRW